jgi:hypothetical protein
MQRPISPDESGMHWNSERLDRESGLAKRNTLHSRNDTTTSPIIKEFRQQATDETRRWSYAVMNKQNANKSKNQRFYDKRAADYQKDLAQKSSELHPLSDADIKSVEKYNKGEEASYHTDLKDTATDKILPNTSACGSNFQGFAKKIETQIKTPGITKKNILELIDWCIEERVKGIEKHDRGKRDEDEIRRRHEDEIRRRHFFAISIIENFKKTIISIPDDVFDNEIFKENVIIFFRTRLNSFEVIYNNGGLSEAHKKMLDEESYAANRYIEETGRNPYREDVDLSHEVDTEKARLFSQYYREYDENYDMMLKAHELEASKKFPKKILDEQREGMIEREQLRESANKVGVYIKPGESPRGIRTKIDEKEAELRAEREAREARRAERQSKRAEREARQAEREREEREARQAERERAARAARAEREERERPARQAEREDGEEMEDGEEKEDPRDIRQRSRSRNRRSPDSRDRGSSSSRRRRSPDSRDRGRSSRRGRSPDSRRRRGGRRTRKYKKR